MKLRRQVIFVNEASSRVGMGHILRSQVLARIMATRDHDIAGITIGDEKAVLYAREKAAQEKFEWAVQVKKDARSAIEYIRHTAPNIVIADCAEASREIICACAALGIRVVALDYFLSEMPLPAAIINLIDHNPATLAGCPPARDGVAYYEGAQYAIIRAEFQAVRNRRILRGERASVENILIVFGGADPAGNTRHALDRIAQYPAACNVGVVIGPLFEPEIKHAASRLYPGLAIRIHTSPKHMGELFEEADLAFCGGGGTLLETMCVGVPAIVIAQNDAEARHAKALAQRKACWLSEDAEWGVVSPVKNREFLSRSARACVDGRGAERICDILEQQLK